ncbi:MAG: carboxypeptidase-like regulatory domain-containing protein [Imperialibacter sp.]|uniref:carboxypeptidase-like regulatory domain-containing protein n=1 Tax=Imperialibacter sp. TaxID=2038411 RepID=UPI0032EFB923
MKNQLIILMLGVSLLSSCTKDEELTNENVSQSGVISGDAWYVDALTGSEIRNLEEITIEISNMDSELKAIPREVSRIVTGAKFEFGPLPFGTYKIELECVDSVSGINYEATLENISISKDVVSVFQSVELSPSNQTVIVGKVVNGNDMPVPGAKAFLYSDPELLKYKDRGGFVDSAITNRFGKAAFIGHAPGQYYIYASMSIDTVHFSGTNAAALDIAAMELKEIEVKLSPEQ